MSHLGKRHGSRNFYVNTYIGRVNGKKKYQWVSTGTDDPVKAEVIRSCIEAACFGKFSQNQTEKIIDLIRSFDESKSLKLEAAWSFYLENFSDTATAATMVKKRGHWNHMIQWMLDQNLRPETLNEISEIMVANYFKELKPTQKSANYNKYLNNIRNIWRSIMSRPQANLRHNPFDKILTIKDDGQAESFRPFTDPEIAELHKYFLENAPHWALPFQVACYTGLRQPDVIHLQVQDIDFEENIFIVDPSKTKHQKGSKNRLLIPVHNSLIAPLKRHCQQLNDHDFLFPTLVSEYKNPGKPISRFWTKTLGSLNIKGNKRGPVSFKSIRHWLNTSMQRNKTPQETRRAITGHSSDTVNDIYSHDLESLREAIENVDFNKS